MIFDELIESLEQNILLPAYSAERRIDLFVELWLPEILSQYYQNKGPVKMVVPEFPLKHENSNRSDKLDFLCLFEETKQPIFVELKTDIHSLEDSFTKVKEIAGEVEKVTQAYHYIKQASNWKKCIEGLGEIIRSQKNFDYRKKYLKILIRMYSTGIISLGDTNLEELEGKYDEKNMSNEKIGTLLKDLYPKMEPIWDKEAQLIYIAPANEDMKKNIENIIKEKYPKTEVKTEVLDFSEIAGYAQEIKYHKEEFYLLFHFLKNINSRLKKQEQTD
jgi:hypothetical protein